MNKKFKYTSLVAAGAVTLGLVGGTLAWFTAQDEEVNKFSTTGNEYNPEDPNAGIDIVEDWDEKDAQDITPGTEVNKDVQVKNTENYDQFIKATLKVKVTDGEKASVDKGVVYDSERKVYHVEGYPEILLTFTNHFTTDAAYGNEALGTWYNEDLVLGIADALNNNTNEIKLGDFYYIGKVAGESHTNTLLDAVKLTDKAGNQYKNLKFDIVVVADGIQTTNDAAKSEWKLSDDLAPYYTDKQDVANPIDGEESLDNHNDDGHDHGGLHVKQTSSNPEGSSAE